MIKKLLYIPAALLVLFAFASCSKDSSGMDESSVEESSTTEEDVYQSVEYTRQALRNLYGVTRELTSSNKNTFSRMKDMNTTCALLDNATDDGCGEQGSHNALLIVYSKGGITATSNPVANTHPWNWYYMAIRQANGFLENVDNSVLEDSEKIASKAEARFLRALYYHELYRWFGPFVIMDKRSDPFDKTVKRESEKNCVEWLVNEFDELIKEDSGLLDEQPASDYGRATRGAAYAYKARTLLYAASPLHKDSGVTWAQAAQAALDMIEYSEDGGYFGLYYDAAEPAMSYKHLFNTRYNNEYIFFYNCPDQGQGDIYNMMPPFNPWNTNKEISTCPTQRFIDQYDMIDGTPAFNYDKFGRVVSINDVSGYDDQNPYANRDPRLDQTILHDGMSWLIKGSMVKADIATPYKWVTGYFVIKYFSEDVDHMSGGTSTANFPSMRYAEVLLNYAEAINEAADTDTNREKAVEQLNRIRNRAGIITDLDASDFTQQTLRERIRRERRVELSWEEHRFFDMRRWKIATEVMNDAPDGMKKDASGVYTRFAYSKRIYPERMDLLPIPVKDVNGCEGIWQNPGY